MKNKILFSFWIVITGFIANAQENNVNIPNNIFKTYLLGNSAINTNGDNEIQLSEASAFMGTIDVINLGISDLTGIEAFTSLTVLKARSNNLTSLDITNNTALTLLDCGYNDIASLDISNNTALIELQCSHNELSVLDVSNNTALTKLNTRTNNLTSLDLSNNLALTELECSYNQLTSLDLSNNIDLIILSCRNNQISSLDLSFNTALIDVVLSQNQISTLDVSNNTSLGYLSCDGNQLTSLDVSNNEILWKLACGNNQLNFLDVSNNSIMTYLVCFNNQLTSLNIANGNNHNLTTLNTTGNLDLACIQVDNESYSNTNWTGGLFQKDVASVFSEDCNLNTDDIKPLQQNFLIHPNPTNGMVYFSEKSNIKIFNTLGQIIAEKNNTNSFDFFNQPTGVYFVLFGDKLGKKIQQIKIVKQ